MGRAVFISRIGGPEVLELRDHDPGEPGAGQVRVRVAAAGVNFIDIYFRSGAYKARVPSIAGVEGAGEVEAVGPGVTGLSVGARVAWAQVAGSYAEHVLAPVERLVELPEGVSTEQAGAVLLQGMTAHYLVEGVRETRAGDVALVHAAAGGTGLLLVQSLKARGARVYGTCSSAEKEALVREAGADEVIRYDREDFVEAVKALAPRGVDVVYDAVGQSTFDGSLRCLRARGLLVLFGQASGAVPPFDLQRLNQGGSLFVTRPSLAHYTATRQEFEMRARAVLEAVAAGKLSVRIGGRFELARAGDAQSALEGRSTTGKVVLSVN